MDEEQDQLVAAALRTKKGREKLRFIHKSRQADFLRLPKEQRRALLKEIKGNVNAASLSSRTVTPCPNCKEDMVVANGQVMKQHKRCKKRLKYDV